MEDATGEATTAFCVCDCHLKPEHCLTWLLRTAYTCIMQSAEVIVQLSLLAVVVFS